MLYQKYRLNSVFSKICANVTINLVGLVSGASFNLVSRLRCIYEMFKQYLLGSTYKLFIHTIKHISQRYARTKDLTCSTAPFYLNCLQKGILKL